MRSLVAGRPSPGDRRKAAWPAALDDVVAVGAAHGDARPAELTPRNVPWIDVHATGVDVDSGGGWIEPGRRALFGWASGGRSCAAPWAVCWPPRATR